MADSFGMIRDVMQKHLSQILSLIAMATSASNDPVRMRDSQAKVLLFMPPLKREDIVLGQYVGKEELSDRDDPESEIDHRDDPCVPDDSIAETHALAVLGVHNKKSCHSSCS